MLFRNPKRVFDLNFAWNGYWLFLLKLKGYPLAVLPLRKTYDNVDVATTAIPAMNNQMVGVLKRRIKPVGTLSLHGPIGCLMASPMLMRLGVGSLFIGLHFSKCLRMRDQGNSIF